MESEQPTLRSHHLFAFENIKRGVQTIKNNLISSFHNSKVKLLELYRILFERLQFVSWSGINLKLTRILNFLMALEVFESLFFDNVFCAI